MGPNDWTIGMGGITQFEQLIIDLSTWALEDHYSRPLSMTTNHGISVECRNLELGRAITSCWQEMVTVALRFVLRIQTAWSTYRFKRNFGPQLPGLLHQLKAS